VNAAKVATKASESEPGRLIVQEGDLRVVRTGPHSMVIEERLLDSMGAPAWVVKAPLSDVFGDGPVEGLLVRDLYLIFSSWERS
jgi:hypothetical protein